MNLLNYKHMSKATDKQKTDLRPCYSTSELLEEF